MIDNDSFPNLTPQNHRHTSPRSLDYNCVAWAAGDMEHWRQPGVYWPIATPPDDYGIGILEQLFRAQGYANCEDDGSLEPGFEEVALYGNTAVYTHVSRQLPNGKWTSKLGKREDIEHDTPKDVADGVYGELLEIMKRPSRASS